MKIDRRNQYWIEYKIYDKTENQNYQGETWQM